MDEELRKRITARPYRRTANLDPRCKLALLLMLGTVSYFLNGEVSSLALLVGFAAFVAAGSGARWAAKLVVFYVIVANLMGLLHLLTIPILSVVMSVFGVTILKLTPIVMVGIWTLRTMPMDDFFVALERMHLPQSVTIPLVVMCRYIPTLASEYRMIRNTMDIRGLSDTLAKRVLHPLQTVEYILIPLLMRCLKVTDELAASGATRGLERQVTRHALDEVRLGWQEWLVMGVAAGFLAGLWYLDQGALGEVMLWRLGR
ncbi:MAG: energy-coupling factor transporter transmembrane component T [Peptococcaceae bacterium]|nr:energy-coupling factor transporter transmembrane component T [Peptococcaceae bacterium]